MHDITQLRELVHYQK